MKLKIAASEVEINFDGNLKILKLLPVDSENDALMQSLFLHRNSDFFGATFSMSTPKGQSFASLKKMIIDREHSHNFHYFILLSSSLDDAFLGKGLICGLLQGIWKDTISRVVEVGINIYPEWRDSGIGKNSLDLLMQRLTIHFNVYKYVAKILSTNSASQKLFESKGFEKCGCYNNHFLIGGNREDVYIYEYLNKCSS